MTLKKEQIKIALERKEFFDSLVEGSLFLVTRNRIPFYPSVEEVNLSLKGTNKQYSGCVSMPGEYILLLSKHYARVGVNRFAVYCFLCSDGTKKWIFPLPEDFKKICY